MKKLVLGMMVAASLLAAPAFADDAGAIPSESDQMLVKVGYGLASAGIITAIILTTRQDNNSGGGSSTSTTPTTTSQ